MNYLKAKLKQLTKYEKSKFSIQYEIPQTGLDENTILLIETNKYKATLDTTFFIIVLVFALKIS